jgi:sensor histidine kinase regulating citrate/malate metabolism
VKNPLEQRAITDALFECLGDGVLAVDATGTILVANASARRMFNGVQVGKALPSNWPTLHRSMGKTVRRSRRKMARSREVCAVNGPTI